ncbi:thiol reductant ABC exporter subunit CydC [Virgibacillus siamensis]|uniref:thiol reductant ABC exporter subunit CydC n=1 Tax=Virgibacillus siamensis TaxID=480071 RepID=UPI0009849385|nr:thiol reductant ABC exporter subunit CydC [Virgibacillus siamensis]
MKDLVIVMKLMMIEKKDIVYSILFAFIAGVSAVGLFAASGYLISKAALAPPLYALIILTSTVKMLGITKAISKYAERYFSHRATFTILSNLRVAFFEKLEPLAPGILQRYRSGDLLARIVGDVESLQNFFLRVFYPPIVLFTVFLSTILFTAFYSIYAALILLAGLLLTVVAVPALFTLRQANIDNRVREKRGGLSTEVTELFHGFRDLKIYQKLDEKKANLLQSSKAYINEQKKENINTIYSQSVNTFLSLLVSWCVLATGVYLVVEGHLEGIFLAMLLMISLTVFEDAPPMAVFPIHLQDSMRAATRLFSVVHHDKSRKPEKTGQIQPNTAHHIKMDNITFSFPGEKRKALEHVNVHFPAGSKTAIVGPSGCGKSTLLQLILKMNQADTGNIRFDDILIDDLKDTDIWKETNVVLQENHFFYGTIRSNLLLAKDDLTDAQMWEVLKKLQLDHFTLSDPVFEKGENLSGGEKQRLAIARAMLKGARVWLLDEPTSSIDALTEHSIYQHLFDQAKADTLILVSHRLTGLEQMDQIIVMDQGTIIESGTFEELMQLEGYFYQMKQIEKDLL